jgi:hypothetical protein
MKIEYLGPLERRENYDPEVIEAALKHGVDPDLALAVHHQEYSPDKWVSSAKARGPMQLMPDTARGLGVDPDDPKQNIDGGVRYLKSQLDKYRNEGIALAAYNAGPGAVDTHGGIPPYYETQKYVMQVRSKRDKLKRKNMEPVYLGPLEDEEIEYLGPLEEEPGQIEFPVQSNVVRKPIPSGANDTDWLEMLKSILGPSDVGAAEIPAGETQQTRGEQERSPVIDLGGSRPMITITPPGYEEKPFDEAGLYRPTIKGQPIIFDSEEIEYLGPLEEGVPEEPVPGGEVSPELKAIASGMKPEALAEELQGLESPSAFTDPVNLAVDIGTGFMSKAGREAAGAIAAGAVKAGSKALGKEVAEQAVTGGLSSAFLNAVEEAGAGPILQELSGIMGPMATATLLQMPRSGITAYLRQLEAGNPQVYEKIKAKLDQILDNPAMRVLREETGGISGSKPLSITFKRGDVTSPKETLRTREKLRAYLSGIDPEQVKALKLKSPEEYKAFLRKMVDDLFPDGGDLQFRKTEDGKTIDLDHFLTDSSRQDYIHTLPETLRREDIRVEFRNGDADKAYFIKKYFDSDIQKDIWDVIVVKNGELRTKFARKDKRGRGYVESLLMRDGFQASVPSTPGEIKESASTHTELPVKNVSSERPNVKTILSDESGSVTTEPLQAVVRGATKFRDFVTIDPIPATSRVSKEAADAAVQHAAARQAVPHMVDDLLARVFPNDYRNPEAMARTRDIMNKDNILDGYDTFLERSKEALKNGDPKLADEWDDAAHAVAREHDVDAYRKEVLTLIEAARNGDPEARKVVQDIQRWKAVVNPILDGLYREMKNQDPTTPTDGRGRYLGARVNLTSIDRAQRLAESIKDHTRPMPEPTVGGNYRNPNVKRDPYGQAATFTGQYTTDMRLSLMDVLGSRWNEVTKFRLYKQLVDSGAAELKGPGAQAPAKIQGQDVVRLPVKTPVTGRDGKTRMEDGSLFVRSDLAREIKTVLGIETPLPSNPVARVLTQIQLAQIADAVTHSKNILSVVTRAQGAGSIWQDVVRKVPIFGTGDAVVRISRVAREVMRDSPEIRKEIANMAASGLIRPHYPASGLQKITKAQDFLHRMDTAARVLMNRFFDNLVERGLAKDTAGNRRQFINQVGQYNGRLQGPLMKALKESGMSPFIVAGRNFNRQGIRGLTGHPGLEATGPAEAAQMRMLNLAGTVMTLTAIPMMLNMITTGKPGGRSGTPVGAWDLGTEENEKGKHRVIDLLQMTGLRRGMRLSGADAVIEGIRAGHTPNQIAGQILEDVSRNVTHPWVGPAPGFVSKAITGRQLDIRGTMEAHRIPEGGGMQAVENVRAALESQNPLVYSMTRPLFERIGLEHKPEEAWGVNIAKTFLKSPYSAFGVKDVFPHMTAAEKMATTILQGRAPQGRTPGQVEETGIKRQIERLTRDGKPIPEELRTKAEALSSRDIMGAVKRGKVSRIENLIKPLEAEEAISVLKVATPEERGKIIPLIIPKVKRALEEGPDERTRKLMETVQEVGKTAAKR